MVVLKVSHQNNRLGKFDVIHKSLADEPRSSDYHRCVVKYDIRRRKGSRSRTNLAVRVNLSFFTI